MGSEQVKPSAEGAHGVATPSPPRTVAPLLTGGVVLLVVGLGALVAAAHESLYFAAFGSNGVPLVCPDDGSCSQLRSYAVAYAWAAIVTITAATWLLAGAARELGRRSDAAVGAESRDLRWG